MQFTIRANGGSLPRYVDDCSFALVQCVNTLAGKGDTHQLSLTVSHAGAYVKMGPREELLLAPVPYLKPHW
jgi:hypothetical protein